MTCLAMLARPDTPFGEPANRAFPRQTHQPILRHSPEERRRPDTRQSDRHTLGSHAARSRGWTSPMGGPGRPAALTGRSGRRS